MVFALTGLLAGQSRPFNFILAVMLSLLCSAGLFYGLYTVSKGNWIGGGDVKLAVVLGLVLGGPAQSLMMLFIASLIGTVYSLPLMLSGKLKKNSRLPFGPLLITSTIVVYLFGAEILAWYQQQFLAI